MKRFWTILISLFLIVLLVFYLGFRIFEFFKPYLPFTNYLLGIDKPTSYLVLLGNDAEMRANGGFAGSYAKITLSPQSPLSKGETPPQAGRGISPLSVSRLGATLYKSIPNSPKIDLSFQDIYVPNGQIQGLFVAPPDPIQQAFGHGTWELANADWEPDFPSAAKSLRWFLEKGHETNPDILAILNLSTIKKVLAVVGSFPVPEYKATLTPDNLYLFLQGKAELNFFPGSTQKKDALTAVGGALVKKVRTLPLYQKFKIAQILYLDLQNQNIVLNSLNPDFQNFLVNQNFAGVFQPEAMDTYAMIETNLGANKANAYVTRQTTHTITFTPSVILSVPERVEGSPSSSSSTVIPDLNGSLIPEGVNPSNNTEERLIHHSVTIKFINSSLEANPNPPFHYGGDYIAYLRLYIPENAQNITLNRTPEGKPPLDLPPPYSASTSSAIRYGLTELGFWHTTRAGNESTINLDYYFPLQEPSSYTFAILKQHGMVSSSQIIDLYGASLNTDLKTSFFYP